MKVYENIKAIRHLRGWSQQEMAGKLAMSLNGYSKIERGKIDIQLSRLEKIAEILKVKVTDLFDASEKITSISSQDHSNQHNYIISLTQQIEIKQELERVHLFLESKDKEIEYLRQQNTDLREMVNLLKNEK
ncbi:MAG: hypothetical protein BWK79_01205 [Beggiatoa sp. IS2]|nr:MAG: hypothetical protein BWK79_01205 [Beggiatoa sp. IS2]